MNEFARTCCLSFLIAAFLLAGCDSFTSAEARISRAEDSIRQGDYLRAIDESKRALDKEPGNAEARLILAEASLKSGDLLTAEQEISRASQGGAVAARLEPLRLDVFLGLGRVDAAWAALDSATTLAPGVRDVYRGRIMLASNEPAAAIAAFDQALAADPASLPARLGKIDALIRQSALAAARAEAEAAIVDHPDSGLVWLAIGGLDLRQGRYQAAADALLKSSAQAATLSTMQRIQARAGRVEALILAGTLDEASRAQEDLEAAAPGSVASMITGARIALARGQPKSAVESLQRIIQDLPGEVGPRALLVTALLDQGSTEQALTEAGRLVAEFPHNEQARMALAYAQIRGGRPDDAQQTLKPLVDDPNPSAQAISLAAQIELRQGRSSAGLDFLERGVETSPGNAQLKLDLASAYVTAGRASEAVDLLRSVPDGLSNQRDRLLIIAEGSRDPVAARAEIDRALGANPHDVGLLNLAAAYLVSIGERATARDYLEQALTAQAGNDATLLGLARLDVLEDGLDAAERHVEEVLKTTPNNVAALGLMVEIAARRGRPDEAERWLQEARRADPSLIQPRLLLVRSALARGDDKLAGELIVEIEKAAGDRARVELALGDVMASTNRRPEAMERYRRAAALDATLPQPHLGMAKLQLAASDRTAARSSLNKALVLVPGWLPAADVLARLDAADGRMNDAMAIVADLKRRTPDKATPWLLEGDLLFASRRPAEAYRAYDAAYARQPDGAVAARAAAARRAAGQPDPERPLLVWLERSPGDLAARRTLALMYLEVGRREESISEYEKVVAAAPDDSASLNNLAWLYHEQNDSRAIEIASKAYEMAPQQTSIADTYAWILVNSGQLRKGLDIFTQIADKENKNLEIQYHYAYALKSDGQDDRAREVLKAALLESGSSPHQKAAEELLAALGH